jgi:hypothetical protein
LRSTSEDEFIRPKKTQLMLDRAILLIIVAVWAQTMEEMRELR